MLLLATLITNSLALAAALWLGLYLVTRSPRRLICWLTGLTLWALSGHFLNVLLALLPPPRLTGVPGSLAPFLQFWEANALKGATSWLQGWMIVPAVVLWHHVTTLMRAGKLNCWHWTRLLIGYGFTIAAIVIQANTPLLLSVSATGDPLYLSTLQAGSLYPLFLTVGLVYIAVSLANLLDSARTAPAIMPRNQWLILAAATLIAGAVAPLSLLGSVFGLRIPIVAVSLLLGCGVVLIGYGVAQYSALVEGRTIRRDFYSAAAIVGLATGICLVATWFCVRVLHAPAVAYVLVILLVIPTHSLVDGARYKLDSSLHRRDLVRIQTNLDRLARAVSRQDGLEESLSMSLDSLCASVRAIYGLIVLFEDGQARLAATCRWRHVGVQFSPQDWMADDVLHLKPGRFPPPLTEAALLIPLYADTEQLGALVLGRPVNGLRFSQEDVDQLLYPSDRLASIIHEARRRAEHLLQLAHGTEMSRPEVAGYPDQISVVTVEDALRHMAEYAYLGDHALAQLKLVKSRVAGHEVTHLDVGKAVHSVLADAIERLRPDDTLARDPPPRDWHPYLVLHDAYLEGVPNRDIMSRLYISEGTFNRTRRVALRAVVRALEELEAAVD